MAGEHKRAFITGISGQDGSYLAEYLRDLGYEVGGLVRRNADMSYRNIAHLIEAKQIQLFYGDLAHHPESIVNALVEFKPDEIYNLAAQSHPGLSFDQDIDTLHATGESMVRVFKAARSIVPNARGYHASTSEMYGEPGPAYVPQNECTPFEPANPYAAAKMYAHFMCGIYNRNKNQPTRITRGILYNHESPRRGDLFLPQKVAIAVAAIHLGKKEGLPLNEKGRPVVENGKVKLGDLDAQRDWGSAKDYVKFMHKMVQLDKPEVIILGTGKVRTVRDLCEVAFRYKNLDYQDFVVSDESFKPDVKTGPLQADPTKAKELLGFDPDKLMPFEDMIAEMVEAQIQRLM